MRCKNLSTEQLISELLAKEKIIKKLENDLRKLQLIFDYTRTGIVIGSANGKTLKYMNPAFAEMHGYTVEELTGRPVEDVIDPGFRPKLPEIKEIINKKGFYKFECMHMRKDGTLFPVLVESIAVGDELLNIIRDITERKRIEDALHMSEKEKTLILDGISEIVLYYDTGMRIKWANKTASLFTGLTPEQLKGRRCHEVFFNSTSICANCMFKKILTGVQAPGGEIKKIKGKTLFVRGYPVHEQNGTVTGLVFVMTDLTERKQLESALLESEKKFATIYDAAIVGITLVGLDGTIIDCNKAFQELLGYDAGELKGMRCWDLLHNGDPGLDKQVFMELVTGKRKYIQVEKRYRRKDGDIIWIRLNASAVRDGSGNSRYIICITEDITKRKLAEKALLASEEKFRLLFHNANDAIFLSEIDSSGSPGRFVEVNDIACERLGYSREEFFAMTPLDINSAENAALVENFNNNILKNGAAMFETVHVTKTGDQIPVEVNAHLFTLGEKRVVLAIARDLTERKKAEAELAEARYRVNRTERLASLGTLAAGIAHEINQPLNALKIIVDSLLYRYQAGGTIGHNEVIEELNKVSKQAERIGNVVNRTLGFVRRDYGVRFEHCDLNKAVEGALNIIGQQLAAQGIKVVKSLFQPMPLIWADKSKLEEVVINLVVNAMQALDTVDKPDKEIIVATGFVKNVILEVSDNATGVDDAIIDKIFEPLFTTKEAEKGTGLGLAIVYSIVSSLKGQIHVKTNQMGGATFRVELPVAGS